MAPIRHLQGSLFVAPALFLHFFNFPVQFASSFQVPASSSPLLHTSRPRRRSWLSRRNNGVADADDDDDDAAAFSDKESDGGGSIFNEKAILGETLDVSLQGGTYSWSNPKSIPKDDIRSPLPYPSSSKPSSSSVAAASKDRYKRIPFDGCGSILLHQQPEAFLEPNTSSTIETAKEEMSHRHRRKGRTGVTLWSASYVISYYIDAQWSKCGSWYNNNNDEKNRRWTVLELGAGLGLCSAVAAKHGMNVVSTDNDSDVLTLLKDNLRRNSNRHHDNNNSSSESPSSPESSPTSTTNNLSAKQQQEVHIHSLDWMAVANDPTAEASHPVFVQLESLGGADLILLSDVIYGATQPAWEALLTLLNKFRVQRRRILGQEEEVNNEDDNDGNDDSTTTTTTDYTKTVQTERGAEDSSCPLVLLGYTQRRRDMSPQDEARFFAMLQAAGMEAVLIPSTRIPHGEKYMLTSLFELRWIAD